MITVQDILSRQPSHVFEVTPEFQHTELADIERELGAELPTTYHEFISEGGLGHACFHHKILRPSEIMDIRRLYEFTALVPFADNGCGDYYCWELSRLPQSPVKWWDHEINALQTVYESFLAAIDDWRW